FAGYKRTYHGDQRLISPRFLVTKANKSLRPFGFVIKRSFDEIHQEINYVLMHEIQDSIAQQSLWTQHESTYFYSIIDRIVSVFLHGDDNASQEAVSIRSTDANNLARNSNLTIVLGEKLLKSWIEQNWFVRADSGRIGLGVRALTEKSAYLVEKYGLSVCASCNLVCLYGRSCEGCSTVVHDHCCISPGAGGPSSSGLGCALCNRTLSNVHKLKPRVNEEGEEESENEEEEAAQNEEEATLVE